VEIDPSPTLVLVLTTVGGDADAASIAATLVEERLAACVNVYPVRSTFRWRGAVEVAAEQQLVLKTTTLRLDALLTRLTALHPYEVPEVLVVPVRGAGASYAAWVGDAVSEQGG
jgi:periplasmic divalent cation tolerance protein